MKKTLLVLLLTLCMLVTVTAFTASAEETETAAAHADHCVCGGSAVGVHDHECEDIVWTPLTDALTAVGQTETSVNFCKIPSGNYYLTNDIKVTSYASGTNSSGSTLRYIDANITLCLNGHNITTSQLRIFGTLRSGYEMNLCDCSGTQAEDGSWSWEGTITASDYTDTGSNYGGIFYTYANSVTNIWGGNYIGGSGRKNGSAFVVSNDGYTAAGGKDQYTEGVQSTLNIYNGYIQGSTTTAQGGTIMLFHNAILNVHGGTITGGSSATNGGNIYASKGTINVTGGTVTNGSATKLGGNIFIGAEGTLNISGGTISNGTSVTGGGNIYTDGSSVVTISGGTISNGKSDASGGNMVLYGTTDVKNATITGGTCANYGGNIYTTTQLDLTNVTITDGTAGKGGGNVYAKKLNFNSGTISGGTAKANTDIGSADSSMGGGNIYITSGGVVNIKGGTISGGTSKAGGGSIYITASSSNKTTFNITGGTITGGASAKGYSGGSIRAASSYVTLNIGTKDSTTGPVLEKGVAAGASGGMIYTIGTVNVYSGTISGGNAGEKAGNIYCTKILNITGGTISGGTSKVGGNIYLTSGTTNTISNATITGGTANNGGNIYIGAGSTNTISNVTISGGTANGSTTTAYTGEGGNIYTEADIAVTLTDCTVTGGTANYRGGNICSHGNLTLVRGSVEDGSAVHEKPVLDTAGEVVSGKATSTSGGNLYCYKALDLDGTTVSGGKATHGGNITVTTGTNTIKNATISDGNANQMCDGTTNGNGGNIYSTSGATTTITDSTITGGVGRRGASVGAWGKVTIENTTITGGYAYVNGGNIMTYGSGQLTLKAGTVLSGGEAATNGGAISFSSSAGKKHLIEDGVKIITGTCKASPGIYLSGGDLTITGAPEFDIISFNGSSQDWSLNIDEMTATGPIEVTATKALAFTESATDRRSIFVNTQGYLLAYRDGKLYLDAPAAVFVSDNGSDDNNGSQSAPYKTLNHALAMVANNGTVTIVDKLSQPAWSKHSKSVTLTGGELDLTSGEKLTLGDSTRFTNLTVTMPTTKYTVYCNGLETLVDEDVTVRYYDGTSYATQSVNSYIYGGLNGTVASTDLTVLGGTWGFIYGGSDGKDIAGDVHLTVGGKVNQGLDYVTLGHASATAGKYLILGGSRAGNITGTVYMNVGEGTTGSSIHGGSNGAVHVGNIELTVTGGEGMAIYGAGRGGAQTVGTVNMYYEGGQYEQVFGGVLSNDLTGDVNMYVTGGKITRRLYGGCYSGYENLSWTADNLVTGNIKLYIGEGADISCDADYSDRGIYGHSRRGTCSTTDAENATVIFLNQTAYNENKDNLGAVDFATGLIMGKAPVADLICYLDWSADDEADVIYANAVAVQDPKSGHTGDASAVSASAALTLSDTRFYYTGNAIEPATVTVSDNWHYGDVKLTYADNTEIGTGKATVTANGYTVNAEFAIEQKDNVAQVIVDGETVTYQWLQDAIDAAGKGGYLKLISGTRESVTVPYDLYLDLSGYSITGTVTVAEGATLYGMDSTTDDYDCSDGNGTIKVAGDGELAVHYKTDITGKIRRYVTYTEEDGTVSFHRIYLGITHMSLRTSVKGVGYKATFRADQKAKSLLNGENAFGYNLWLYDDEGNKLSTSKGLTSERLTNEGTITLRLQNFDIANYGDHEVYASVYMNLGEGENMETINSSEYYYTLKAMLESIDDNASQYSEGQLASLQAMLGDCAEALIAAGWDISNIMGVEIPQ